jgi:hypothetical protein
MMRVRQCGAGAVQEGWAAQESAKIQCKARWIMRSVSRRTDMSSVAETINKRGNVWWIALAGMAALILAGVVPNVRRSRTTAEESSAAAQHQRFETEMATSMYYAPVAKAKLEAGTAADAAVAPSTPGGAFPNAASDRKIVRSGALEMIVLRPAEMAEKIRLLAEAEGGFLVSSDLSGGENATAGTLTIRVPATQFEQAWAEIHKLGLRVETEKIEAEDVTRQYVDQDASLRNLRAEETQYLAILKQAGSVKDLLAVSEKLAEVRGQIEQQQAEFNALSKQVETVAIAISLRTEAQSQVLGLNWRPLYEMKLALRDGLDAVAIYAAAMISILFYLPAVLLWMGTIVAGVVAGWKVWKWAARAFFAGPKEPTVQNG